MTPRLFYFVLNGVLAVLMLGIIGGAVGGNHLLQKQANKLQELKVESESIDLQQTALSQAKRDVEKYSELEQITKSVVPQDKDQALTVREIIQIAALHDIPIKSVTFPASTLGAPAAAAPAAPASGEGAQPAAPAAPPASQLKAVQGIADVYTLEVQVTPSAPVPYENFLNFLNALEKNRRTAHVQAISLSPSDDGETLSFNLTLNAYVKIKK